MASEGAAVSAIATGSAGGHGGTHAVATEPAPTLTPGVSPVDAAEIARTAAQLRASGTKAEAQPVSAEQARADADDAENEVLSTAERLASGDAAALKALDNLSEDDIADLCELGFGLVADIRGAHWELSPKSTKRLARCFKRSVDRHGIEWAMKWMPDVMSVLFLGYEVWKRVEMDREIAAKKTGNKAAA